jgi:hypothetical protein
MDVNTEIPTSQAQTPKEPVVQRVNPFTAIWLQTAKAWYRHGSTFQRNTFTAYLFSRA